MAIEYEAPRCREENQRKAMPNARKSRSKTGKGTTPGKGKKRAGTARVGKKHKAATSRQFGALRGVVSVDEKFFEPLASEELEAWER